MTNDELERCRLEFEAAKHEYEQMGTGFLAGSLKWEQVSAKYNVARDSYDFALRAAALKSVPQATPPEKDKIQRFRTAFGEFTVTGILGEGGTGRVFETVDDDGRKVAVKCLLHSSITRERAKRFKNEIGFCQRNTHPNIITALDWGLTEVKGHEVPFYVMPRFGSNLRKLMQAGVQHDRIIALFNQIVDGVLAAHEQGVWHRDLKPENILYDPEADQIVVADFGIAHFAEPLLRTLVQTGSHDRLANFQYAAPEQRTMKTVDQRADIYALGMILNEMFTGELLQGTQHQVIASVASDYRYLDDLVHRMVTQSPEPRPSISEVKDLLNRTDVEANSAPNPKAPIPIPVPGTASSAITKLVLKLEEMQKVATRLKLYPIIPIRCASDECRVTSVGTDTVELEKLGSGHHITVPLARIREILPDDAGGRAGTMVLDGRLQWISISHKWRFFLETPSIGVELQIGFGKLSGGMDQKRIDTELMLKSRGRSVWLIDERYLNVALAEGRQIVYDEDGRYFRVPSGPNHLVLIGSGP